jgi:hypothetical protein
MPVRKTGAPFALIPVLADADSKREIPESAEI